MMRSWAPVAALADMGPRDRWSRPTTVQEAAVAGALLSTANPGVRRLATVGGTIAARLPSCDLAAALAAHRAQVESVGRDGVVTTSSFIDFWRDADRRRIVTEVRLDPPARGAYRRHSGRRGPAPALASVAATANEGDVSVWAGAVATAPLCLDRGLPDVEDLIEDHRCSRRHRLRLLRSLATDVCMDLEVPCHPVARRLGRDPDTTSIEMADGVACVRGATCPAIDLRELGCLRAPGTFAAPDSGMVAGAQFVEVVVDTHTGEVSVEHVWSIHYVGRLIHPDGARGQVYGGIVQGLGLALTELGNRRVRSN